MRHKAISARRELADGSGPYPIGYRCLNQIRHPLQAAIPFASECLALVLGIYRVSLFPEERPVSVSVFYRGRVTSPARRWYRLIRAHGSSGYAQPHR